MNKRPMPTAEPTTHLVAGTVYTGALPVYVPIIPQNPRLGMIKVAKGVPFKNKELNETKNWIKEMEAKFGQMIPKCELRKIARQLNRDVGL